MGDYLSKRFSSQGTREALQTTKLKGIVKTDLLLLSGVRTTVQWMNISFLQLYCKSVCSAFKTIPAQDCLVMQQYSLFHIGTKLLCTEYSTEIFLSIAYVKASCYLA